MQRKAPRAIVQRWHELDTWPDFATALVRLRARYVCVSFTILSLSLVFVTTNLIVDLLQSLVDPRIRRS